MVATNVTAPVLQRGASGAAVKDLQELLIDRVSVNGLTVDGHFGQITELAVKVFQQRNFLESDGIVGSVTWLVLMQPRAQHLPVLRRGDRGIVVERLQRALHLGSASGALNEIQSIAGTRGYYFGQFDGDFGPATERAVKAFQQNPPFGWPPLSAVDGIVGSDTWGLLMATISRISHHFL